MGKYKKASDLQRDDLWNTETLLGIDVAHNRVEGGGLPGVRKRGPIPSLSMLACVHAGLVPV